MRVPLTSNCKIHIYDCTKRLLSKKVNFTTSSKALIGFPFSSSVIIGQKLTVPSVFYFSANTLVKYNLTNFIQNKFKSRNILR